MTKNTLSRIQIQWQPIYNQLDQLIVVGEHSYPQADYVAPAAELLELCPLHRWGLIAVRGVDAADFLQGQLTADVNDLADGQSTLAAHCDAKGRMNANFVLYRQNNNDYLLLLPITNVEQAIAKLSKYAVFSKVDIVDFSTTFFGFGTSSLSDTYFRAADTTDVFCIPINNNLHSYWIPDKEVDEFVKSILVSEDAVFSGSIRWEQQLTDAGIGFIDEQTAGLFIPQMLNMDLLGGISFNKGCYTGQEIIARMKYRGEVKRRCYQFSAAIDQALSDNLKRQEQAEISQGGPGAKLYDEHNAVAGEMVSRCVAADNLLTGLAVVKTRFAENNSALFLRGVGLDEKNSSNSALEIRLIT